MKTLVLKTDKDQIEGKVLKVKDTLWVHLNGETFTYKPETGGRKDKSAAAQTGVITAPMPGKIIKINIKSGQKVEEGTVVIIMEAMKMEYSLKADKNGNICYLGCAAGDQVQLGQKLAEIN